MPFRVPLAILISWRVIRLAIYLDKEFKVPIGQLDGVNTVKNFQVTRLRRNGGEKGQEVLRSNCELKVRRRGTFELEGIPITGKKNVVTGVD